MLTALAFRVFKLRPHIFNLSICHFLVLGHGLDQLVLELDRPVALDQRIYKRPDDLPLVNPLCDPVIDGGAAPNEQKSEDNRWVEQAPKDFEHGLAYLAKALRYHPPVEDQQAEDEAGEGKDDEDFVHAQGKRLLGDPNPSLCSADHFFGTLE